MKLYISILLVLVLGLSVFGQTTVSGLNNFQPDSIFARKECSLTLKDLLALRGIKFNMSPSEVSKILAISIQPEAVKTRISLKQVGDEFIETSILNEKEYKENIQVLDLGDASFLWEYETDITKTNDLEGVSSLYLRFYKNALYHIDIDYGTRDGVWKNVEEFTFNISEKLNLPKEGWKLNSRFGHLNCREFRIFSVFDPETGGVKLGLYNTVIEKEISAQAKQLFIKNYLKKKQIDSDKKRISKP